MFPFLQQSSYNLSHICGPRKHTPEEQQGKKFKKVNIKLWIVINLSFTQNMHIVKQISSQTSNIVLTFQYLSLEYFKLPKTGLLKSSMHNYKFPKHSILTPPLPTFNGMPQKPKRKKRNKSWITNHNHNQREYIQGEVKNVIKWQY